MKPLYRPTESLAPLRRTSTSVDHPLQRTSTSVDPQTPARAPTCSFVLPVLLVLLGLCFRPSLAPAAELSDTEWSQVLNAQTARVETIARISRPTIAIFSPDGGGGGSGVIVSPDGYALTNFHVVKPCGDYLRCGLPDGKLYEAVVVGVDPTGDVGLIKLLGRDDFPTAELGDSDQLAVGDWCYVVGNPFLLASDFQPTVTYGIVSGVHRYQYPAGTLLEYADCIQTDASINPGNSGGPLFNSQGQLVGINGRCSFEKRGRVNVGVGYAISINQIQNFYGYLRSGRIVDHATLGATVSTSEDGRVVVSNILSSSDAYRRGLRYEDEIVSLGGKSVRTANEFKNILGTYPRGWRIPVSFRQDGVRRDVLVRLTGVHSREDLIAQVQEGPRRIQPEPDHDKRPPRDRRPRRGPDRPEPDRIPVPHPGHPAKVKTPDHVASLLESRRGYANYYFNRQNVRRVWDAFLTHHAQLQDQQGEWVLRGKENGTRPFELVLRDHEAFGDLATGQVRADLTGDLDEQLAPPGSGGLLLAVSMWRRLLSLGPNRFGEVYYLGTVPDVDGQRQLDVLVATHDVTESHFQFDPDTGHLVRLEMFPSLQTDPCELIFSPPAQGQSWPQQIAVRYGDSDFAALDVNEMTIAANQVSEVAL